MITGPIETGLSNYYGDVKFVEHDGNHYMTLDNWDGERSVQISKEFYDAAVEEFVLGGGHK